MTYLRTGTWYSDQGQRAVLYYRAYQVPDTPPTVRLDESLQTKWVNNRRARGRKTRQCFTSAGEPRLVPRATRYSLEFGKHAERIVVRLGCIRFYIRFLFRVWWCTQIEKWLRQARAIPQGLVCLLQPSHRMVSFPANWPVLSWHLRSLESTRSLTIEIV